MPKLETLKTRQAFMQVKVKGKRIFLKNFILQGLIRQDKTFSQARWGFIITKKMGSAVIRNLIRRRLKEIIRRTPSTYINPLVDYVIVVRKGIEALPFASLEQEFSVALRQIHATNERYA